MRLRYRLLGAVLLLLVVGIAMGAFYVSHDASCAPVPSGVPGAQVMKAIVYRCYGGPEVLKLETVGKPLPPRNAVLVRVHAASVNPLDWHYMRGKPYVMRRDLGIGAPKHAGFGLDFAGTVEAVGAAVTGFKPGDEVFGSGSGAFAEYIAAPAASIALKPADVSFEQLAAAPTAAVAALQALRDQGHVQPGQRVLINGASGGVGTYAVQLAKHLGAQVTAVCSARNADLVRMLGADRVIDYTKEDFTRSSEQYDFILDAAGSHTLAEYRRVMKPGATLVTISGSAGGDWFGPLASAMQARIASRFLSRRFVYLFSAANTADLTFIADLMHSGELRSVVDKRFALEEVPAAVAYVEQGHSRGKVTIAVPP